jgi:hypothetical protein
MTDLKTRKTCLRFKTEATIRGRQLIVEVEPHLFRMREAGRRHSFELSWEGAYWVAVKKAVGR